MKRYKPKIKLIGPYNFDGVQYIYKCYGLGYNGYGETVDESYKDWKDILGMANRSGLVFVWINEFIYKMRGS